VVQAANLLYTLAATDMYMQMVVTPLEVLEVHSVQVHTEVLLVEVTEVILVSNMRQ
jgi:hypothetical protein